MHKMGGHFIVYNAWHDLFIIRPGHGMLCVKAEDKADKECARAYLLKNFQLKVPLQVCRLIVTASCVRETKFNMPKHYRGLKDKYAAKHVSSNDPFFVQIPIVKRLLA